MEECSHVNLIISRETVSTRLSRVVVASRLVVAPTMHLSCTYIPIHTILLGFDFSDLATLLKTQANLRPEFAKTFQVKVWTGSCLGSGRETRWDKASFASFRREVGRMPFKSQQHF